jgi:hypothetical protein
MSLLGFDAAGSATINGLTEINANNVFSDVLYYDASTTPVNVKTAIDGITIDVTALEADVATLQSEMNAVEADVATLQGEVNTLQSEMNTAQSDINTLQSEMNTAQSDIVALYSTTATTAAAVAGLAISQAAQDVTLAAHTASIGTLQGQVGTLQGEMTTAQANITALEVKTVDMSWATISKTTFSTKVNVGTTLAGVTLNTASESTFGSGIKTDTINSDNTMTLTADGFAINATSAGIQTFATLSSLFQSTTTTTLTSGGETEINCAALDINATGTATLDATGFSINATSAGIQTFATLSSLFQSTTTTTLTSGGETEINCAALDINATGAITIDTDDPINLNSTANGINLTSFGEQDITCGSLDINSSSTATIDATTNITITAGGTNTFTSTGETEINCVALDINASGALTIDPLTFTMNATELIGTAMTWQSNTTGQDLVLTNPTAGSFSVSAGNTQNLYFTTTGGGEFAIQSSGNTTTSSVLQTIIAATTTMDLIAGSTLTIDSVTNRTTATTNIALQIAGNSKIDIVDATVTINPTTTIINQINGADKLTITSTNVTINPLTTIINQINGTAKLTITSTTTTHDNNSTFNGNVLIQQTTYPPTSTSALGYTNSATTFTDPMSNTLTARSNFSLPSKGVWLIVCGYEWGTNTSNTVEAKALILSETSGSSTPAAYGLEYFEEINDAAGAAGARQTGTIMGVFTAGAATTIYVNARSQVASGTNTELRTNVSWSRIG